MFKNQTGKIGEEIACKFLVKQGFKIIARNYSKKFGEIDIIATQNKETYFIEVKATLINPGISNVSQETSRPEERVDRGKIRRISKAIQIYLSENKLEDSDWNFLVISVLFDKKNNTAHIKVIEDVIPE